MVHLQPQSLVRRGEILIGFDVIDNWGTDLKEMNKDKVGLGALSLSSTFLLFLGYAKVISFYHTDKQGVLHKAMLKEKVPSIPDYTTISSEE
jgi:hypothetical protein